MRSAAAILLPILASSGTGRAFVPSLTDSRSPTLSPHQPLRSSYLDTLGEDPSSYPPARYPPSPSYDANPYSSTSPGYDATYRRGYEDSAFHGYKSELRALHGNYNDARGPNLGYDDDLKYVDPRNIRWRPVRGRVMTESGWRPGAPRREYGAAPSMDRSPSVSAHNSWWDNAGQTYQVARGAQGGFNTYTDMQARRQKWGSDNFH